jgi:sugar phosphate isomerase/epimerase
MKYLIEATASSQNPYYKIPDIWEIFGPRKLQNPVIQFVLSRIFKYPSSPNPALFDRKSPYRFDGAELNLVPTRLFTSKWEISEKKLDRYKKLQWPLYTFHACFSNTPEIFRFARLNLASRSKFMRRAIVNHIRIVTMLHAPDAVRPVLVFHGGEVEGSSERNSAIDRTIEHLKIAVEEAKKHDITIVLENAPRAHEYIIGSTYEELQRILDEVDDPDFGLNFDWGHANTWAAFMAKGRREKQTAHYLENFEYVNELIRKMGKRIYYAHIHYNRSHRIPLAQQDFILRKPGNNDLLDQHAPLSELLVDGNYEAYRKTIRTLMKYSSLESCGFIHLELFPRKIFRRFTSHLPKRYRKKFDVLPKTGSDEIHQLTSLFLLKEMIEG